MADLMAAINQRALAANIPLSAHIDLTWRCNERCLHCYLDHDDPAEFTLAELRDLLDQMADAGTLFLTLSGGEIFLRKDLREIVAHARKRNFDIRLKTNAMLIGDAEAAWISELGVHNVQISVYSDRAEVHDEITKVRGSLRRTLNSIRFLRERAIPVTIACVIMRQNAADFEGVQRLARELDAEFTLDPTITPHLDGHSLNHLGVSTAALEELFHNPNLTGGADACMPPPPVTDDILDGLPCSAGHTACYISPHGELWPCVQFPVVCGDLRQSGFAEIWKHSPRLAEIRSIRARDLTTCSGCGHIGACSRCPGLAYMEGSMYGPSSADCEKSFARTGIPSANMLRAPVPSGLVQISL